MKPGQRASFHCWKRWGHGWLDMHRRHQAILRYVYFYDLGAQDSASTVSRSHGPPLRAGPENPVSICPASAAATIPSRAWKLATIGEPWQGGETLVAAMGQGFVLATPLQLAVMTARLASGRNVVPRDAARLTTGMRSATESAAAEVCRGRSRRRCGCCRGRGGGTPVRIHGAACRVISRSSATPWIRGGQLHRRGTAFKRRIKEEGWEMAGKTGTSQVRRLTMAERAGRASTKNEQLPWRRRDHGLFVCFAPVHKPRYACAVVVEHGGGGSKVGRADRPATS